VLAPLRETPEWNERGSLLKSHLNLGKSVQHMQFLPPCHQYNQTSKKKSIAGFRPVTDSAQKVSQRRDIPAAG
jgi:hypothetical protein